MCIQNFFLKFFLLVRLVIGHWQLTMKFFSRYSLIGPDGLTIVHPPFEESAFEPDAWFLAAWVANSSSAKEWTFVALFKFANTTDLLRFSRLPSRKFLWSFNVFLVTRAMSSYSTSAQQKTSSTTRKDQNLTVIRKPPSLPKKSGTDSGQSLVPR